jgi:hypothetical protein
MKVNINYDYSTCQNRKSHRADRVEPLVWDYVSGVMKNPEELRSDLDRMIELKRQETRGDPEREAKVWLDRLAETDQERRGYLRLAAKGRMTDEDLDEALAELEETRKTAERELAALRGHEEYIRNLERERDAMLDSLEAAAPEALDSLTPEQRQRWYKILRLTAAVGADGTVEISWAGAPGGEIVCEETTLSPSPARAG